MFMLAYYIISILQNQYYVNCGMIAVDFCTDTGLESGPIMKGKLLGRFFTMSCKNSVKLHLYIHRMPAGNGICWWRHILEF